MSFPRYPKYKDSGVEWLGEVPEEWEVKRIRHVATLNPSKSELSHLARDTEVSFLPMEAVGEDGKLNFERTRPISEVDSGYTYFREGDVTIAKITPCYENGKGAVMRGLTNGFGFGTTELTVVRPREIQATSDYLHRLFNSTQFRKLGEAAMYGAGGQKRVPDDFVRDFSVAFPPIGEQNAIATFLDRETAKIDALVAEQENLITLLKEKRQAVISHAVSKGLDPTVPMKDSGIEWLGEVPAHWNVRPLRYLVASIESGTSVNAIDCPASEGELGVLKTSCVYTTEFNPEENKTVIPEEFSRVSCPLRAGTLIVSRMNTPELVGAAGLVRENRDKLFLPDRLWQVSFENSRASYMHYWTQTIHYRAQVKMACAGTSSSMQNLSQDQFNSFVLAVPHKIQEQDSIVEFLDTETAKLDDLTTEALHTMDLLKERRSALISAAVTGKIDVRGYHVHSQPIT